MYDSEVTKSTYSMSQIPIHSMYRDYNFEMRSQKRKKKKKSEFFYGFLFHIASMYEVYIEAAQNGNQLL